MDKEFQNRLKHFTALKSKYQAIKNNDSSPSSPLYLILRKADLNIELNELESEFLLESGLVATLEIIGKEKNNRTQELLNLEIEFSQLKSKYKAKKHNISWVDSKLYYIILKLE
ncbi:MAG: hypothetical protein KME32_31635 [Mojavia pulchra JT2-VF2]|jgi:hypothetical protein|uniref:Uncharacterized protein n=1 Tax=Mojavia pulchra JT2-VF2 TaxID=287848 RepID=A0A951Q4F0_9NOST|nr:hypothetical protein [Mojavia pulchra JT2-VF2]